MMNKDTTPVNIAVGKPAGEDDLIIVRRHRLVSERIPSAEGVLLDFGCGSGAQTHLFAGEFPSIIGLDVGQPSLRELKAGALVRGQQDIILPLAYDGDHFPLCDSSIDCAVSFEVLEHVEHETQTLSELARVIKPGGFLAMSVPNRWWIFETHGANLPLLPWNRVPFFSWLPTPIHDRWARARIYSRREIRKKVESAGFDIVEALYITAPMDVVKWRWLKKTLRATIFRNDTTHSPFLSTAVLVVARRQ
ncbi:MAG: class I SAM-dependent methyltransferase [Bacteroidales bacterium]|nr:class I SAM-dependent methyltransferase [Candidatus Latescibacterota bacterium]